LVILAPLTVQAATLHTRDGLCLTAQLPPAITRVSLDGRELGTAPGGLSLSDPRSGQAPPSGAFALTAQARAEAGRVVIAGVVKAAGDQETVCQLQAAIPVGDAGWLFWDNMSKSRPVRPGEVYEQPVYPLACVTSADQKDGVAVAVAPDPVQPASLSYDPGRQSLVVTWRLGFTPLARPELRMQAPFRFEVYRLEPGWAFRSALDRYYQFHPDRFDWRARHEGLWEFATDTAGLPNPQHYAYNEGGPPATVDQPRGIHTFPYTCTGDLVIPLPPEWGVPKTYEEMLERLERWRDLPRLVGWEQLSPYEVDKSVAHSGERSLKFRAPEGPAQLEVRKVFDLNQKHVDPLTVCVWTRAEGVTGVESTDYGLWLDLVMADGTNQFGKVAPAAVGTHDWQELKLTVGADKPISRVSLYLLFRARHTGTAWFDDASLTLASAPDPNLVDNPGFESAGPPPELQFMADNVMYDPNDHMRYFADTWGGADVALSAPINWLRFMNLVNPDAKLPGGRQTEAGKDLGRIAAIFRDHPACAGIYMDGTSFGTTVTFEYRRDAFPCFRDPFTYEAGVNRVCANGMASVIRYVDEYKRRFPGKLAFGNVWASNRMFPVCMALDVPGYESSRWYDLQYADYYRAAAYHKPALYLNYFRIGQQLDTREGGERFFRYATGYGIFPSIGRFTDEAYEKFGDLQHLYIPIVKHLFRAGWEPVTRATCSDGEMRVQRFGGQLPVYFTVLNPTANPRPVTLHIDAGALGLPPDVVALEMSTSAGVPLEREGGGLTAALALGPQDVAVLALLPKDGVADWYRERAAEILQGAAYVYAQTPPTNVCTGLSEKVRSLMGQGEEPRVALASDRLKTSIRRLERASRTLPADLKRTSYQRELAETIRLLDESLLADTGAQVGWQGRAVGPADEALTLAPVVDAPTAAQVRASGAGLPLKRSDPSQSAATFLTTVTFTDAAGRPATLQRRGHGYFGPLSETRATYDSTNREVTVRLRNLDRKPRSFRIVFTVPDGLSMQRGEVELAVAESASGEVAMPLTFAPTTASGSYPVGVAVRLADGMLLDEATVSVPYVLPLAPGDLALAASGAQVAVDSAYYAYTERPLTDGIVLPGDTAFNQSAWAAAEAGEDHWVQLTWPQPQRVGRVEVYWNIENDVTWTSQRVHVQARQGEGWETVAEVSPRAGEPVTTIRFDPVTTTALRLLQPKGSGPATRPNIMWLREVAVYGG
jgi:hypothetical protein